MTVKELFTKHGIDNAELQAEVEVLLTTAESKKTDGIPLGRFNVKVKECNDLRADKVELEQTITDQKTNIETLETNNKELKKVQKEFDIYKKGEATKFAEKWNGRKAVFDIEDTDPEYEKVNKIKHKFHFAEEDKELTAEQVIANNTLYDTYDEIGYFKKDKSDLEDGKSAKGEPKDKFEDPLDQLDKIDKIEES